MGVWELGASGSAMMRVYLVVVGSRRWMLGERCCDYQKFRVENGRKYLPKSGSAVKLNEGALMVSVVFFFSNQRSRLRVFGEQRRSEKKEDLPRVEKILPNSTALLPYDTLNALLGRKSGIKLGVLRSN